MGKITIGPEEINISIKVNAGNFCDRAGGYGHFTYNGKKYLIHGFACHHEVPDVEKSGLAQFQFQVCAEEAMGNENERKIYG